MTLMLPLNLSIIPEVAILNHPIFSSCIILRFKNYYFLLHMFKFRFGLIVLIILYSSKYIYIYVQKIVHNNNFISRSNEELKYSNSSLNNKMAFYVAYVFSYIFCNT